MVTRQHSVVTLLALLANNNLNDALSVFQQEVPWVLLPDGIRAYIGPRQAGHFEQAPDGDIAWMKYPSEEILKKLTRENAKELVEYYVPSTFPKCAIGEKTRCHMFVRKNIEHEHFKAIISHLVQDTILDSVLRTKLIDHSARFEDVFFVRHSGKKINGQELRNQVKLFEEYGFIHLLGRVYSETGLILDGKWFDENVYNPLLRAYPEELAESTYKFMRFSQELQDRVVAKKFELSQSEIDSVYFAKDLIDCLDSMYDEAVIETTQVFKL